MMDPAKLKVVELRAELSKRGLETKGNKPVLVERLRKALEEETGGDIEDAAPVVDSVVEKVVEPVAKDAREKTPEPSTPMKGTGRSSRSAASTPTKTSPSVRGTPKILLTPVPEKVTSPVKSPIVPEKMEKMSEPTIEGTSEAVEEFVEKPETRTEPERIEEARSNEVLETAGDVREENAPDVPEVIEKVPEIVEPVIEEPISAPEEKIVPEVEKVVPEVEKIVPEVEQIGAVVEKMVPEVEKIVPEVEKLVPEVEKIVPEVEKIVPDTEEIVSEIGKENEETIPQQIPESTEETNEAIHNQPMEEEAPEQQSLPAEILPKDTVIKSEENNDINDVNVKQENTETIEVEEPRTTIKTEKNVKTEELSQFNETTDVKPEVEVKEEVDEKANVDNALQTEQQDVEMKDIKAEPEDDSKEREKKDRKDRKRKRSTSPQEEKTKSPPPNRAFDEPDLKEADVVLSWYDSDLNLLIDKENFFSATAMHDEGFGWIWAGARASYGFTEGKVYYEAKVTEYCEVNLPDEQSPHVLRVGWSVQGTSMQLGEEALTYGFGGTGKVSSGNKFADYGTAFGKDDVIGCYLDLSDENNLVISYAINGKDLGPAFTVPKETLQGKPLYPHLLTKNCTFVCNFGQEKPWSELVLDGFVPVGSVDLKNRIRGPRRPDTTQECEIIMMCGLPGAGKTVWATKYAENNRDKLYNVLGTNSLIEKMKVVGLPRRRNYHGRWEVLIEKCTRCLNKLLEMASTRRRNYILDQTNVYPSAQRRKMRNFHAFKRRAIVIVPTEEEFKSRVAKRTASEGEVIPDFAVMEMKANFTAPVVGDPFDSVEWVELPAEEGKKLIEKYNKEGKEAGYGQQQSNKRPRVERNDNSHRDNRDSRQSSRDSRDSRDHRDRRNNYQDRNRSSTWRGGSNSGGWKDRPARPAIGHVRHGGGSSGGGGSGGGYGGPSSGGWRGRGGSSGAPASSYRSSTDRRIPSGGHDRRTSGTDRNRAVSTRPGGWGTAGNYGSSQQPSGGWGGSSQSANWQGQSQAQTSWGSQTGGWGQQQQQWGNWKGYGQGNNYSQGSYNQQGYGNGNWGGWNQQYYNQYWGQQQPTGQTPAAGSQASNTTGSTPSANSTTSRASTYGSYASAWQGYTQPYGYSADSSNTNTQQQK